MLGPWRTVNVMHVIVTSSGSYPSFRPSSVHHHYVRVRSCLNLRRYNYQKMHDTPALPVKVANEEQEALLNKEHRAPGNGHLGREYPVEKGESRA